MGLFAKIIDFFTTKNTDNITPIGEKLNEEIKNDDVNFVPLTANETSETKQELTNIEVIIADVKNGLSQIPEIDNDILESGHNTGEKLTILAEEIVKSNSITDEQKISFIMDNFEDNENRKLVNEIFYFGINEWKYYQSYCENSTEIKENPDLAKQYIAHCMVKDMCISNDMNMQNITCYDVFSKFQKVVSAKNMEEFDLLAEPLGDEISPLAIIESADDIISVDSKTDTKEVNKGDENLINEMPKETQEDDKPFDAKEENKETKVENTEDKLFEEILDGCQKWGEDHYILEDTKTVDQLINSLSLSDDTLSEAEITYVQNTLRQAKKIILKGEKALWNWDGAERYIEDLDELINNSTTNNNTETNEKENLSYGNIENNEH